MSEEILDSSQMIFDKDLFNEELEIINEELKEIDDLYAEIKTHYDRVKNSSSKGSLTFVEKQTNNLISMKTTKLQYIKERANMKKTLSDLAFKQKNSDKSPDGGMSNAMSEQLFNRIAETFVYNHFDNQGHGSEYDEPEVMTSSIDEELESAFSELDDNSVDIDIVINGGEDKTIKSAPIEDSEFEEEYEETVEEEMEEEVEETSESDDVETFYAFEKDSEIFYELDNDMNIVNELGSDFDNLVEFIEQDGEEYGVNENGEFYLVIEFE